MVKCIAKMTLFLILVITVSSCSCNEDFLYDIRKITYKDKFVFDSQFRMDGMYLWNNKNSEYSQLIYFFQNGYYYKFGILYEEGTECYPIFSDMRARPWAFGCFIIENNILKLQHFNTGYTESGGFGVSEDWGEIINDTTIHLFKRKYNWNGKEDKKDETYHFRHCENKPDSINILMNW